MHRLAAGYLSLGASVGKVVLRGY